MRVSRFYQSCNSSLPHSLTHASVSLLVPACRHCGHQRIPISRQVPVAASSTQGWARTDLNRTSSTSVWGGTERNPVTSSSSVTYPNLMGSPRSISAHTDPNTCQKECQNRCQLTRMSKYISDRMSVGGDHSSESHFLYRPKVDIGPPRWAESLNLGQCGVKNMVSCQMSL